MSLTPIGMNFTALNNLTFNLSITTNPVELLNEIPATANSLTNSYLAYGILFGLLILLYSVLSDKTPFGDFNYDDARALCIALGVCAVMGITMMEINFLDNLRAVGLFIALFILSYIFILIYENKE